MGDGNAVSVTHHPIPITRRRCGPGPSDVALEELLDFDEQTDDHGEQRDAFDERRENQRARLDGAGNLGLARHAFSRAATDLTDPDTGADHEVAPRQPVEERAEREADDDGRQVGDDEDGADPEARVRPVLDVDRERDRRQKGADRRPEGRDRQQAKTRVAERQQLTADSCQGAPDANTLSGALRDA